MKLSISLSAADVALIDEFAARRGLSSRSAAVQHAVRALRWEAVIDDYAAEFADWDESPEAALWDTTVGDGSADAPR